MKTTIKRHRRMTKHRKGTTKPRKSIRRIKNRRYKTRRQSGGGYTSFINANENKDAHGQTGIDVKVSTDRHSDGTPMLWLIGGNRWYDATFGQLKTNAKGERYQAFIAVLETDPEFIETPTAFFTNPGRDADSSKGIKLNHDKFCRLFINGPLDYPELKKRFRERNFTCSIAAVRPSGSAAFRAPSSGPSAAFRAPISAATQRQRPPDFSALSDASFFMPLAPQQQQQPLQQQPVSTKYFKQLQEIKVMNLENVTDQMIVNALNDANGNADAAVVILLSAAGTSAAQQYAESGPSAAVRPPDPQYQYPPPSSAAQQYPPQQYLPPTEETIQRLMIGKFTRNDVLSALQKTNNDVAAAIDLLNQEASYLKNPETFVNNYVTVHNIPLSTPSYEIDRRNLSAFPGFNKWRVVQTVGDGNCLTHAFLQCLSPTYGRIKDDGGYNHKYAVALEFRKVFSQTSDLARDKNTYSASNYTGYLTDNEITDYSRLFDVITVVFENQSGQTLINASNFSMNSIPTDRVIFIHGDGGHYSSVMLPNGQFTMTLAEARKITGLQQSLTT